MYAALHGWRSNWRQRRLPIRLPVLRLPLDAFLNLSTAARPDETSNNAFFFCCQALQYSHENYQHTSPLFYFDNHSLCRSGCTNCRININDWRKAIDIADAYEMSVAAANGKGVG